MWAIRHLAGLQRVLAPDKTRVWTDIYQMLEYLRSYQNAMYSRDSNYKKILAFSKRALWTWGQFGDGLNEETFCRNFMYCHTQL